MNLTTVSTHYSFNPETREAERQRPHNGTATLSDMQEVPKAPMPSEERFLGS